jgi:Flp pilus assembly pilin Flp
MWRQRHRRVRRRNDRGAVAVEFALLVPILVVILFAIIAVGIALFQWSTTDAAVRSALRRRSLPARGHRAPDPSSPGDASRQRNPVGPGTPTADRDCSVTPEAGHGRLEQLVPVHIPLVPTTFTMTVRGRSDAVRVRLRDTPATAVIAASRSSSRWGCSLAVDGGIPAKYRGIGRRTMPRPGGGVPRATGEGRWRRDRRDDIAARTCPTPRRRRPQPRIVAGAVKSPSTGGSRH